MASTTPKADQALALIASGKLAQARTLLTRAMQSAPADPAPVDAMRALCIAEGNLKQAHYFATRALTLAPNHPACLANLAALDSALSNFPLAISRAAAALALDSQNQQAHAALLGALLSTGRYADALTAAQSAVALFPADRDFAIKHAAALLHLGLADDAVAILSRAQMDTPDDRELAEMLCTVSNYASAAVVSPARGLAIHRAFGRLADSAPAVPLRRPTPIARNGRVRLGFISPDFRAHSVATFALPLISRLASPRHALDVFCYNTAPGSRADAITGAFRAAVGASHFRESAGLGSVALAQQIAGDDLDILIDLAGLTQGHRLDALRHRPARVQATYIGYPNTTGCGFIDARLVDAITDPPSAAQPLATERLDRPSECFLCYQPPTTPDLPPPSQSPRSSAGGVVFGSFNALTKVSNSVLACWARVLQTFPSARLLIKASELSSPDVRTFTTARATRAGIDPSRLELRGRAATTAEHLSAYADIDIALDTYPYNGTTTTCEALVMGVPVLTLAGDRHAARVGASLLTAVGLPHLVAADESHLLASANRLISEDCGRVEARSALRAQMLTSPLCNAENFAEVFAAWARATAQGS